VLVMKLCREGTILSQYPRDIRKRLQLSSTSYDASLLILLIMPNSKIHWKGSPRHHLPRIRVGSTPRNSTRARSQLAAEQVLRVPFGSSLEQVRKKQRFNFRLRKRCRRSSRSTGTLAVVRSQRNAIQRAKQHIQVFGWGASQAELANRGTFETASIKPQLSRSIGTASSLRNQHTQDSVIPPTDGAASSSIKEVKACNGAPENLYSLMHVAEVPVYWKSRNNESLKRPPTNADRWSIHSIKRPGTEVCKYISRTILSTILKQR
jgi:hypothetical protein